MKLTNLTYSMDLQLFAYNPQAQPENHTGAATLSVEDKEYYDKHLIRYAEPNLVHRQFGQKRPIPQGNGSKAEFRCFASLGKQTTPLVEGVTPDGQTLSVTKVEATVYQYGGFVNLTDKIRLTSIDPIVTETVRLIGDQAGLTMDTIVRDVLNTGKNFAYASSIVDGVETEAHFRHELDENCKLTVKEVEKQVTELRSQNAPTFEGGYYICIAHPKSLFDLMRDKDWREPQQYTSEVTKIFKGEVGEIGGCRFIKSTESKVFKGSNLGTESRTLSITTVSGKTVNVSNTDLVADSLNGRCVIINGNRYDVESNTDKAITLTSEIKGEVGAGALVYPGEGGKNGCAVFSNLFIAQDAYGVVDIEGGGLETIIKPLGSGDDPLNQRSTVGWKGYETAVILVPQYLRRLETAGSYANSADAN